ncbi:cyclin-dependent kinase C-2 C-like isoform X1 [Syzygium oleosum]|uniref:cyclin-dependent kinase C-2 C-like isoform X1 n=1 Tax=Syzygium oleosum TaxID=219896 RepID=UPI0011D1A457|nr:cyclin-dependent kinase C-2 C-like isoform X1 [Syzygium oleosum]
MGCICAKQVGRRPASPGSGFLTGAGTGTGSSKIQSGLFEFEKSNAKKPECRGGELRKSEEKGSLSRRLRLELEFSHRYVEAEQAAAGWPSWLTAVAGEAIQGLVPLRTDSFEKLEKIGQGTYSSVFRARELANGRMVALKKVRFDNFQPESIQFMAREISILRRLDHPNIMKLEGIITSRLSNSMYLVFEYMEHDLSGLISSPQIMFSDAQVKCYMKQLLSGMEHCHLHGVIHRDIKASNILVNNEGILRIGDFGLANILNSKNRQQLTSHVVTLWYRPPELLMGSTSYGVTVDLWSVGCVFAELLLRKPILKGRTEVEQLHKIFKLCGSPPDGYWKMSKIPHATIFRPRHSYERTLRERCKGIATSAVNLMETFLSIEPHKRGTASSALISEYFKTKPYACDPSSLPKYPPNKEIDAKQREEAQRKKARSRVRETEVGKKPTRVHRASQEQDVSSKVARKEESQGQTQFARRNHTRSSLKGEVDVTCREPLKSSLDASTISEAMDTSQGRSILSGPTQISASNGFAWARRRKDDSALNRSYSRSSSRSQVSALDSSSIAFEPHATGANGTAMHELRKLGIELDQHDSFEALVLTAKASRSEVEVTK